MEGTLCSNGTLTRDDDDDRIEIVNVFGVVSLMRVSVMFNIV